MKKDYMTLEEFCNDENVERLEVIDDEDDVEEEKKEETHQSNVDRIFKLMKERYEAGEINKEEKDTIIKLATEDENKRLKMQELAKNGDLFIYSDYTKEVICGLKDNSIELDELFIPDGVVEIIDNALNCLNKIKTIRLPKTIRKIGRDAYDYYKLESFFFDGTEEDFCEIELDEFEHLYSSFGDTKIYFLDKDGSVTYNNKQYRLLTDFVVPKNVKKFPNRAFDDIKFLKNIYYDGTIEDWYKLDLEDSTPIRWDRSFYIYDENGDTSFKGKKYKLLKDLIIPEIEVVKDNFKHMGEQLDSITIPKTVKKFNFNAFNATTAKKVYYDGTIEDWLNIEFDYNLATPVKEESLFYILDPNGNEIHNGKNYKLLEEVIIPNYVTEIKYSTFQNFNCLKKVVLHKDVKLIDSIAFSGCTNLKEIDLSNVKQIRFRSFEDCTSLEEINFSEEMEAIFSGAFSGCTSLKKVTLPNVLSEGILLVGGGDRPFKDCDNISEIVIRDDAPCIGTYGFIKELLTFNEFDNAIYIQVKNNKYHTLFRTINEDIKTCIINEQCREINPHAFSDCEKIKEIYIPKNVSRIGDGAFYHCSSLEKVNIPKGIKTLYDFTFSNCENLKNIDIPDSVEALGDSVFSSSGLEKITLSDNIAFMGEGVFDLCKELKVVKLPSKLEVINEQMFEWSGIEKITIPKNVKRIKYNAFSHCLSLAHVELPKTLEVIEESAFYNSCIENISLPNTLKEIGRDAFGFCKRLKSIIIPNSVTKIDNEAFSFCKSLEKVVLPNSIKKIGYKTFMCNESLKSIQIPNSVTKIGPKAFEGCKNLNKVIMSSNIEYIYDNSFEDCNALDFNFSSNGFYLQDDFGNNVLLMRVRGVYEKYVWISDECKVIAPNAFKFAFDIEDVTIGANVKIILKDAFMDCTKLKNTFYMGDLKDYDKINFENEYSNPALRTNLYVLSKGTTTLEINGNQMDAQEYIKVDYPPKEIEN